MAANVAPGTLGSAFPIQTNIFGVKLEWPVSIWRYDVSIYASVKGKKPVYFTKKSRDEFVSFHSNLQSSNFWTLQTPFIAEWVCVSLLGPCGAFCTGPRYVIFDSAAVMTASRLLEGSSQFAHAWMQMPLLGLSRKRGSTPPAYQRFPQGDT
ncbi:hypothetical protein KIN20_020555 [Parelaphostrongylus tenuis]|uniref:Uncharacterized protein n=1 Tax=Parelaphostrongylus tenuis TaxID=148309 RepID=A0AAD5MMT1_PARTN|nr:hypothetical protein KIN20_020555 [Parelaphostrongylus tenuis]